MTDDWINRCHFGDARAVLRQMYDDGVTAQMCVTSPPYFGLRSYLPEAHPDKAHEIGLEQSPQEYVDALVEVFRGVRDVLADDGTLWLNLADSYASKPNGPKASESCALNSLPHGQRRNEHGRRSNGLIGGLKHKDLMGIPWRVALALQDDGWYLRQDIIWHKPNPMPESVTDRCTKAHEYLFLLSKSERYFFDNEAIKEEATKGHNGSLFHAGKTALRQKSRSTRESVEDGTRNRRSVWHVATTPYAGAHFAVFPPALIEPCILAGTSTLGHCPVCGSRWARQTEPLIAVGHTGGTASAYPTGSTANRLALLRQAARERGMEYTGARRTTGWKTGCVCDAEQMAPDVVLDPFFGSGTSGQVAQSLGRAFIGIELNPGYQALQNERLCQPGFAMV